MGFRSLLLFVVVPLLAAGTHLEEALRLQSAGKLKEADREVRLAIEEQRPSADSATLARTLSTAGWISVSLGNYREAIHQASEAVTLHRTAHEVKRLGDDLNTLALAHQNLGEYNAALDFFNQALTADRSADDTEGEITRLNNIGSVYYLEGRYFDALSRYQEAKGKVDATSSTVGWKERRRQLTVANLATLYQRLGKEETALTLYRDATGVQAMPSREQAQLLLNQGTLYRRLGDPVKALELYQAAQTLNATGHYSDGEIGALRNIGIVRAMDLDDLPGAIDAFTSALKFARESANRRAIVQASLYRGEVWRRLHQFPDASRDAQEALAGAAAAGLLEEKWRALYLLGRIADADGNSERAQQQYRDAIAQIESVRSGLTAPTLRNDFLADKRDVYDALIDSLVRQSASPAEIFRWIEKSRARTLGERLGLPPQRDLAAIQAHLPLQTVMLDLWLGANNGVTLWITAESAGLVRYPASTGITAMKWRAALHADRDESWHEPSRALGRLLLTGVPRTEHLIVVPDGPLAAIPFEALTSPQSNALLVETTDVSYLPAAQFLLRPEIHQTQIVWPWQRQMVAWGDPPVASAGTLDEAWQPLPSSVTEVRSIEQLLPGHSETHLGGDARKRYLSGSRLENVPYLHFSTHAMVDAENPERSRLLLASDYLFQGEAYSLDLKGVDLVTLSACDTAIGKTIRGEGVEAFNQAFLAAGAAATMTSLWRVSDGPTAALMKQFYYRLGRRETKAQSLRLAKLELLRSGTALAHPRHWAGFVLTGNGWTAPRPALSWSFLALVAAALLAALALLAPPLARFVFQRARRPRPILAR